mgnify:CR=1 FL=1
MNPGRLLKKIFSLTLSAFAVLIVSGFLSLQPIAEFPAYAQQASSSCTDITMTAGKTATDSVLVEGIPNSGGVDFGSPSDITMQACADEPADSQSDLKGWAWNTNLGWMSFYCGADGKNNGISCGTIQYGATLNTSTGGISGFTWGDNIGWISMSGASYGVKVAIADGSAGTACPDSKKGDLYGYAWTDTVGWMNFCGAHVDLDALTETPPDIILPITDPITPEPTLPDQALPDIGVDVENQVADIQGNVSINVIDTSGLAIKTKISQSLGEQAQSQRESFYRAVKSSMKGDFFAISSPETISSFVDGALYYSSSVKSGNTKKPCTIILDNSDNSGLLNISGNLTVVSKGCNIFIDSNLRTPIGGSGRLGIIALQDLTIPGEQKGGNIYVCGRVTDIEANLVADGALMSYGNATDATTPCEKTPANKKDDLLDSATGYPNFGYMDFATAVSNNITTVREFLRNQLTIWGSLVSNNTYGGSVSADNPPPTEYVLGDGSKGTQEEARLFDLNYLRYAKTEPMSEATADEKCWMSDVGLSKYFGVPTPINPCDASNNNPYFQSIVNVIYRAPTSKMPVFNAVK